MAFHLKQLFPSLCTILLLLSIMSFSHAKAQPCKCKCSDSDQDRRSNHTIDDAGSQFYLIDKESGLLPTVGLSFVRNLSSSKQKNFPVLSTIDQGIHLWQVRPDGLGFDEASFSVTIVYQPLPNQSPSGLSFLIIPFKALEFLVEFLVEYMQDDGRTATLGTATVSGSTVSFEFLLETITVRGMYDLVMAIDINIDANMQVFNVEGDSALTYAVWIDYDRARQQVSVYVNPERNYKPESTIVEKILNISDVARSDVGSQFYAFGLLSTAAQQLNVIHWNATVEDLTYYHDKGGFPSEKLTILSSVLGSVAATVVMATAVVCYFNSRYRRWNKDLDQLARSMERLPGVPIKVEFADIKKATGNFHETMKLGGGGFGTVYRCTPPATASKRERPMDVAVKRFTREVQNRRYDDFLAEVSIINRLRHKNIVPLVGLIEFLDGCERSHH